MWDDALAEALGLSGVAEKAKEVLQAQKFDETQPGTILRDFTTLVEFIGADGLKTTSKYFMLPQAKLHELNERMSCPVKYRLKRPQQRSFPNLHGLFMILRASGIGIGKGTPPNGRLMIDEALAAQWFDMNPSERYFSLLESWLVQSRDEIVGEGNTWSGTSVRRVVDVSGMLKCLKRSNGRHNECLVEVMNLVTLTLMGLFGWVNIKYRNPKDGEVAKPSVVERVPLGDVMMDLITRWTLSARFFTECSNAEIGTLQPIFQPYVPEWQRNLVPPEAPFREGAHTWRVSLGKAWRRIETPAGLDLDDLAMAILDAFNFDDDHLYCFEFLDRCGRTLRIACGYDTEAQASTEDVRLGAVPLSVGGKMTFLFDYGDEWKFHVELESVDTKKSRLKTPKVIAKGGKAPRQYDYDEDDDW